MERSIRLREGSIPRLLRAFSAPAIVGMVAQAIYNLVDRVFVGQAVGPLGIAGVTVAFPFMLVVMAFGMLVGLGAAALVSIRLGQQRRDDAERVLGNAMTLLVAVSFLLTGLGLAVLDPLLRTSGATARILPFGREYLQIVAAGSIFQMIGFGLNAVIRGEGNPWIAMYTMLLGALVNTILDPIFLFGFGWGMRGAAAATVIAQAVSALWVLRHFLGKRSVVALRARNLRLQWPICSAIIAIGSPMFAMQLIASVINVMLNNQLGAYGGDLAVSTMGIVHAVTFFVAMPVFGINQGAQPIIGYNYGAEEFGRVKRTLLLAILAATAITTAGFLLVVLLPDRIVWLFSPKDQALARAGARALWICMLMWPIVGFQIVSASYFQAVGKPKQALFLSLSRQVLLLIPAVLLLPRWWGVDGIWAAFPVADFGSSVVTGAWLVLELRHLRRRHGEATRGESPPLAVFTE
ncbi:MAG: MATE family efflux transporter [Pirellulales bacterium]|nr:MATE family efflux transporter [Pirellulales bacterium]